MDLKYFVPRNPQVDPSAVSTSLVSICTCAMCVHSASAAFHIEQCTNSITGKLSYFQHDNRFLEKSEIGIPAMLPAST